MTDKTKVGQAVMFANKSDNPKAPKLRVNFEIDGTKYEIPLWGETNEDGSVKLTRNGDRYWSGPVNRMGDAEPTDGPPPYDPGDSTDDIPF